MTLEYDPSLRVVPWPQTSPVATIPPAVERGPADATVPTGGVVDFPSTSPRRSRVFCVTTDVAIFKAMTEMVEKNTPLTRKRQLVTKQMISAGVQTYRQSLSSFEQSSADGLKVLDILVAALNAQVGESERMPCQPKEQRIAVEAGRYP